jgi:glutamate synthase (NADPH/NADH) small chain
MDAPVTVRENECSIIERAFREGYVHPHSYPRNGKKVAVVGAGPAGLSAAVQLNKRGYDVTVLEKMPSAGGLVRYGIPNFKLDKYVIDRRISVLEQEGITFRYGVTVDTEHLPEGFDAYVISTGTPTARDLPIPGRELKGIYFALDLLTQQNRRLAGEQFSKEETVSAKGRTVLVIGGGDTGSDCIGTCHRQGCRNVTQIEIMPKPPEGYNPATPWPAWPMILRTSTSHEEGCDRRWSLSSCRFLDDGKGRVAGVEVEEVEWLPAPDGGRPQMKPTGRKSIIDCDMVLLAMGFLKPQHPEFGPNVFLAGDAKTGTSLVVRALAGGRAVAQEVDNYLKGRI